MTYYVEFLIQQKFDTEKEARALIQEAKRNLIPHQNLFYSADISTQGYRYKSIEERLEEDDKD